MEVGLQGHDVYKSSRTEGRDNIAEEAEKKANDDVLVEIKDDNISGRSRSEAEKKVCRICHFSKDESGKKTELMKLGCDCRGELGISHRACAQRWFSQKRNRVCEICGKTAKNIEEDNYKDVEDIVMLGFERNEMRLVIEAIDINSNENSGRCKMSLCNFLMVCLLLAFILPWFFRGIDML